MKSGFFYGSSNSILCLSRYTNVNRQVDGHSIAQSTKPRKITANLDYNIRPTPHAKHERLPIGYSLRNDGIQTCRNKQ
jgi:hypothetical protein